MAPAVVALTDAPAIAVDASLGNDFRVTLAGNRTMENPANPTDGQKIVFQITQGGQRVDHHHLGQRLRVLHRSAAAHADHDGWRYRPAGVHLQRGQRQLADGRLRQRIQSGRVHRRRSGGSGSFRLFPSTNGPATSVSYTGPFQAGILFQVTTGGTWLDGYWWWVSPTGQSTAAQTFALWAVYNGGTGTLVPNAVVTSGALIAGQWNYVPLPNPVLLAPGACYNACTGFNDSFPTTNNQFGSGDPYSAGIVNGPLSAFSDQSGTLPAPFSMSQAVFSVNGTDPTMHMPTNGIRISQLLDGPPGRHHRPRRGHATACGPATRRSPASPPATPPSTPWRPSSSCRGPARWTTSGSTPPPARPRCRQGAASGMWPPRAKWRAPTTAPRRGPARPGPGGCRVRTAA